MTMLNLTVPGASALPTPRKPEQSLSARSITVGKGILLAGAYGVAYGACTGGSSVLGLALAVPGTFLASIAVAVPSFYVLLSMLEAPMDLDAVIGSAIDAFQASALVLGGLTPSLLLVSASITDRPFFVQFLASCGLLLAGCIGVYRLLTAVRLSVEAQSKKLGLRHWSILIAFVVLVFHLAVRFCPSAMFPIGGAL